MFRLQRMWLCEGWLLKSGTTTVPYFVTWVVKQVREDLTFSALWKSTYYKRYGNPYGVLLTTSAQRTKCIIVSHSENVLTVRNVPCLRKISL